MFWDTLATFVNVVGDFQESRSTVKAAMFNQRISKFNAGVTRVQGQMAVDKQQRDARRQLGAMRANIGASGFDLDGTAYDLLADSTYEANLDAATTRYNYAQQARGYDMAADLYGQQGSDARVSGYISAASDILRGKTKDYANNYDNRGGSPPFSLGGGGGTISMLSTGETIRWNN